MFDLIENDLFSEAVWEIFSVLDQRYVADQCEELLARLDATFDQIFETKYVILDRETGKPISTESVLTHRDAADEFVRITGDSREVGLLLRWK